ncbi:hypothetical protein V1505DRAFT_396606, partial [Lipomyces doorenjongii]
MATMEDIVQPGQGPAQWRQLLCGRPGTRLLSLEKSVADSENTTITGGFDVDSIVGFIPGLGSIRKGLNIFYSPQFNRNLRNDIHIKLSVDITGPDGEPQGRLYAPKDRKHFCMSYIDGMNLCDLPIVYSVVKELFDANKIFPFMSKNLDGLAMDPITMRDLYAVGGGVHCTIQLFPHAYNATKSRLRSVFNAEDPQLQSYGTRIEVRFSARLAKEYVYHSIRQGHNTNFPYPQSLVAYPLPSNVYLDYLASNFRKSCLPLNSLLQDNTKICYQSTAVSKSQGLWIWTRTREEQRLRQQQLEGLGLEVAMHAFRVGWLMPEDSGFNDLTFAERVSRKVPFHLNYIVTALEPEKS